jgi:WD40 repeat protein
LIGDDDWTTTFIDVECMEPIATSDDTRGKVRAVAFAQDGMTALVGAEDSNIALLWDVAALRKHWERQKEEGVVTTIQKPPGLLLPALPHPKPITAVSFVPPGGDTFITACEDRYVRVWQKAPGPLIKVLEHHPRESNGERREFVVRATAIDPSGQLAATGGDDGRVLLWDVPSGRRNGSALNCSSAVMAVAFTSDGRYIITGAKDGRVRVWDRQTRKECGEPISHEGGVSGLSISRAGDLILVGGSGVAQLWDVRTRKSIATPFPPGGPELSVATAISPSNERFLTVAEDGTGKLWDRNGRLIRELDHQDQEIRSGSFSEDGQWVITASDDRSARVWDASSGGLLKTLTHESEVFSAVFAANNRAITSSRDGAQVWDVQLQRPVGPSCKYRQEVLHVACSSDGKTSVLADGDGYGVLWFMPQPIQRDPGSIAVSLQTEVGMRLDDGGGRQVLSGPDWLEQRELSTKLQRGRLGGLVTLTFGSERGGDFALLFGATKSS